MAPTVNANAEMTNDPPTTPTATAERVPLPVKQQFHAGDLDALGQIYDMYSGPVHTVVRGILGPGGQADDAVQESFMRAWRGAGSFDPNRAVGPWLFTIARRTAIDIIRREAGPTRSNHDELTDNFSVDPPGIEDAWEKWEIRVALDQIPEDERTVLMLSHYHGLTHPQIAEHLGVPIGTVKSRSHRAHQRLATLLRHLTFNRDQESSDG